MSSLNAQLNSFKSKVKSAPVLQRRVIEPVVPSKREYEAPEPPKKNKTIVYSQPASTGVGNHQSTLLFHAVEYIKKQDKPVPYQAIEGYLGFSIAALVPLLKNIDRIRINDKNQTAEYVSIYNIYSAEDLLKYLQNQKTFQGVQVKHLKDGWNGCLAAIEQLEQSQDIIVLRTKKENLPRYVWANTGGPLGGIDEEFTNLWSKIKIPASSDLPRMLSDAGLKPASVDPATIKKTSRANDGKKQKRPRRGKITNTHLKGVLKNYND